MGVQPHHWHTFFLPLVPIGLIGCVFFIQHASSVYTVIDYAVISLVFAVSIASHQCDSIIRGLCKMNLLKAKPSENKDNLRQLAKRIFIFLYKVVSFLIAIKDAHLSLLVIRYARLTKDMFEPLKMCSTEMCSLLDNWNTALCYWVTAGCIFQSLQYIMKENGKVTQMPNSKVDYQVVNIV
uniref:7TM_GPCR_Srx domain-containing protein n=1 Tax=Panagrellus redivivus TaxID=6233 RepID=A0A7E4WAJ3_PANRE